MITMKATKKLMAVLLAMLACMSASAQVKFGAKVGLDLTNFWGKNIGHAMGLNYQAGLMMEYKFNPTFAIAPEVVFAAQGTGNMYLGDAGFDGGGKGKIAFHVNYINVPVMVKCYATPAFSIDFGPQVGFNVYSRYSYNDEVIQSKPDHKDETNNVDFGLGLGGTYNLTDNAFVQARYTLGLTKVYKFEYDYRKNGNIQLAFGMKF